MNVSIIRLEMITSNSVPPIPQNLRDPHITGGGVTLAHTLHTPYATVSHRKSILFYVCILFLAGVSYSAVSDSACIVRFKIKYFNAEESDVPPGCVCVVFTAHDIYSRTHGRRFGSVPPCDAQHPDSQLPLTTHPVASTPRNFGARRREGGRTRSYLESNDPTMS